MDGLEAARSDAQPLLELGPRAVVLGSIRQWDGVFAIDYVCNRPGGV